MLYKLTRDIRKDAPLLSVAGPAQTVAGVLATACKKEVGESEKCFVTELAHYGRPKGLWGGGKD